MHIKHRGQGFLRSHRGTRPVPKPIAYVDGRYVFPTLAYVTSVLRRLIARRETAVSLKGATHA